ncbi:MAG: chromate efflux transporter [Crocinitomicaceae bacterium]|nr:chromate efflux transporter [Crocinitomicaceae bacterium]
MKGESKLLEVAKVFFKLGCFAFGGPAAHIAMMEEEVVNKRKWMTRQHYLDLIGATNLIPGPNSTEMTMHCGHERAGFQGLFIAGISFIFPAVITTGLLAFIYVEYGNLPNIKPFFYGIKPAVLAVIASAILKLGKKAIKGWELAMFCAFVLVLSIIGINEILVLLGTGVLGAFYFYTKNKIVDSPKSIAPLFLLNMGSAGLTKLTSLNVFLTFLKVGSILYGSGYVLFAYLKVELVETGFMSNQELLDAIAIGQFTPGPVLSTATFIGYQLTGLWGAVAASVGIFLPSFLFVLILNPLIPKMQKSTFLRGFLDSVNVAAVGIMIAVLITMVKDTIFPAFIFDWRALIIAILSVLLVFVVKKVNVMWIIVGGAALGYLLHLI